MSDLLEHYIGQHRGKPRSELAERREQIICRSAELGGYGRLSQAQADEQNELTAEQIAVDDCIRAADTEIRRAKVERGREIMRADAANREGPDGGSHASGNGAYGGSAPALVKQLGDRAETAAEIISRAGNPWRADGGPLSPSETAQGLISRAHDALEALEPQLTGDGCGRLAEALAESSGWPGMTVRRSKDEQAEAAALFLALSSPHYAEAFRSVLRYPSEFMGAGGTGFETLTDEQRQAWRDVRTNQACRAAFAESSGAAGAFALPLQLDPQIILTNAGSANPFRKLARNVVGTSNVWEGITSAGSTANWLAEGGAVADTTPAIGQLAITPYKESVWIFGSFEVFDDTMLDQQVPALIADAKDRLEVVAFTSGTGAAQPFGIVTHGTSDATVGALTAAMVYALHQALPPRFRASDTARPVWLANVAIVNALRQIPSFAGSVTSMVNDNQADSIPEVLSIDVYEDSAMDASNVVSGHKNLAIIDMSQFVIVTRQPEVLLFEPLFKDQASGRPSGQRGWFSYSRTGSDLTAAAACQYHTT